MSLVRAEIRVVNKRLHHHDKTDLTQFKIVQKRLIKCMDINEHESTKKNKIKIQYFF